jgi:hypothetical protein
MRARRTIVKESTWFRDLEFRTNERVMTTR